MEVTYIANSRVLGHRPGQTYQAELTDQIRGLLIKGRHLTLIDPPTVEQLDEDYVEPEPEPAPEPVVELEEDEPEVEAEPEVEEEPEERPLGRRTSKRSKKDSEEDAQVFSFPVRESNGESDY